MININDAISKFLQGKKKSYPQHVNRISSLDDNCLRRLYYQRANWDKKAETDDRLQGIFETGNVLEPVIERIISEIGELSEPKFRVVGGQTPTNDKLLRDYHISGTIDGILQVYQGDRWQTYAMVDIKTMSPYVFEGIHDYSSLAKHSWTRKYRGQLMLYALAHNIEKCCIIAVNKTNLYDIKFVEFDVDMAYCEELLTKAKQVNEAIANNTPPEGSNTAEECERCDFKAFCCPPLSMGGNLQISTDSELEEVLERISELEPMAAEIKELEKIRDAKLCKGQDIACGRFLVMWKRSEQQRQATEAKTVEVWRKKIIQG